MGVLKHAVLPFFALCHAGSIYACKDLTTWASMFGMSVEKKEDKEDPNQNHMLGSLRGFHAAMLFLCGMGIFQESAHFRKEIVIAEGFLFSVVTVDAFKLGLKYVVPGVNALIAATGAAINSMEPGIFTKDKNK
jgi:hypothetical protein